jgi:hypothetical protein
MRSGARTERMNISLTRIFSRSTRRLLLAAVLIAAGAVRADTQTGRFLLIFETSPALKKNLPAMRQTLDTLFSSNFQNEMQENDDLAVWVVDKELHTVAFPLTSWSPAEASLYSQKLGEFLEKQSYTRHARLEPIQPVLNRVVKNSERLTVLIFCDSQSRLTETPYDTGVNEIITNAVAHGNAPPAFILAVRSYHGEYLGCSVNRSLPLNFPKFPAPPKPAPAPVVTSAAPAPMPAPAPVVVTPMPALIIVGTNATTNISAATISQPLPAPAVVSTVPKPAPPVVKPTTPAPAPQVVVPPPKPAPVTNLPPAPVPASQVEKISTPPAIAATPPMVTNIPPAPESHPVSNAAAASNDGPSPDTAWQKPLFIGLGALAVAGSLTGWLVARARRPRGSLITSSMRDDIRTPRR